MKNPIIIFISVLLLALTFSAKAQTTEKQSTKALIIAGVNTKDFYKKDIGINELTNAYENHSRETKPIVNKVRLLREQMNNLHKEMQDILDCCNYYNSRSRKKILEKVGEYKELQNQNEKLAKELELKNKKLEVEIIEPIKSKIKLSLEKYSKQNGYPMVLDLSNPDVAKIMSCGIFDITQEFIKFYNISNNTKNK